jgi:hypothetical protein
VAGHPREPIHATRSPSWESPLERRALTLWPRLERSALRRCHHDPRRVANLVSRRTTLPPEAILVLLQTPVTSDDEVRTWFG